MHRDVSHINIRMASTNIMVGVIVLTLLSFIITFFGHAKEMYLAGNYVVIFFYCIPMAFMLLGALSLIDFFAEDFHIHHMHYKLIGTLTLLLTLSLLVVNEFKPTIAIAWVAMAGIACVLHGIKKGFHGQK